MTLGRTLVIPLWPHGVNIPKLSNSCQQSCLLFLFFLSSFTRPSPPPWSGSAQSASKHSSGISAFSPHSQGARLGVVCSIHPQEIQTEGVMLTMAKKKKHLRVSFAVKVLTCHLLLRRGLIRHKCTFLEMHKSETFKDF